MTKTVRIIALIAAVICLSLAAVSFTSNEVETASTSPTTVTTQVEVVPTTVTTLPETTTTSPPISTTVYKPPVTSAPTSTIPVPTTVYIEPYVEPEYVEAYVEPQISATSIVRPGVGNFLECVKQHESGGDYTAINPSSGAGGAYQFLQNTWNNTAAYAGRHDLVGMHPAYASPYDQDQMAITLLNWYGTSPWNGTGC